MSEKNMMDVIPKLAEEERVFLYSGMGFITVYSTAFPGPFGFERDGPKNLAELMITKRSKIIDRLQGYPDGWHGGKIGRIRKKIEETP